MTTDGLSKIRWSALFLDCAMFSARSSDVTLPRVIHIKRITVINTLDIMMQLIFITHFLCIQVFWKHEATCMYMLHFSSYSKYIVK